MAISSFFDETREQSVVKAEIVSKYFTAWAKAIIGAQKKRPYHSPKIAYIDLFAGPGRYKDGTVSTPLKILTNAIKDTEIRERLVIILNDKDTVNVRTLEQEIDKLPDIKSLKYKPQILNEEVGENIVKMFEDMSLIPTLFFVDPWGYKGLSLRLVNSVLKDWGCDCIFFFNYNRISMGLGNEFVKSHMDALFGEARAETLRQKLEDLGPSLRELTIVEEICQALKEMGGQYTLPFRFRDNRGTRTSHHLIFVSKHELGYGIMKEIMAKESSKLEQGVPTFEYSPADRRHPLLFELSRPLDQLSDILLEEFAGQTLNMEEIFQQHNVGRRYIKSNYKEALKKLEAEGKIAVNPPFDKRRKNTFADTVIVVFPPRGD